MKQQTTEVDPLLVLAMAGQLTIQLQQVIEFHNEQILTLKALIGRIPRLKDSQRIRLATQFRSIEANLRKAQETIVTPGTIMKWYRRLIAQKWDYSQAQRKTRGRPRTHKEKVEMVLKLARENPLWGYDSVANRMANLGWTISYQTVRNILLDHGIEPAKQRKLREQWRIFFEVNLPHLAALDMTTVEVLDQGRLVRYYVMFAIRIATRETICVGVTTNPTNDWIKNRLRSMADGFFADLRALIVDNDILLPDAVFAPLAGIELVRTPIKAPNCNCYIERFIGSFKREAMAFVIPQSEWHLQHIVREYLTWYNTERNHQGIDNRIPLPGAEVGRSDGPVSQSSRLGGTLKYYWREAA